MGNYKDKSLRVSKKYIRHARIQTLERIIFYLIPTAQGRIKWLRKHNTFSLIGEHVHYQPRKYPTDGKMLKIHDNVAIAADVEFTMHDIIHWVYDGLDGKRCNFEFAGCIEILDNVFVGAGARILPGVSIGPNAIIAAGSLVNQDVPPGTIVGGVPARIIGSFDDLRIRRKEYTKKMDNIVSEGKNTDEYLWEEFYNNHSNLDY